MTDEDKQPPFERAERRRFWGKRRARSAHIFEVKLIPILAMFVLLVLAVIAGYRFDNTPTQVDAEKVSVVERVKLPTPVAEPVPVDPWPAVVTDMNAVIAGYPTLSASATLIDLATGKQYDAGKYTQKFEAASTSKLVAVFTYMQLVEQGKASLDKMIQGQKAQDIIMRMIVYSDNEAWDKLNGYLKFKPQQSYLDSIGVSGSMVPSNIQFTTPAMAKMLQLFYEGKLMNAEHQALIMDYMSHTTMNKLIPAALPADAVVYHKYGQIEGVFHDAAIVEYQGYKFILVVYTDGGQNAKQTSLIHDMTKAVFNNIVATPSP